MGEERTGTGMEKGDKELGVPPCEREAGGLVSFEIMNVPPITPVQHQSPHPGICRHLKTQCVLPKSPARYQRPGANHSSYKVIFPNPSMVRPNS